MPKNALYRLNSRHRPALEARAPQGDIAIAINTGPVAEGDIPKLLQGYDTVIDDATYSRRPRSNSAQA
jgi:hypothetical protein